jgi:serine protease Do
LDDGNSFEANIIGRVPYSDIALIKISPEYELTPINFSKSEEIKVGDWVIAVGNAYGLVGNPTVTAGIVSALERVVITEDERTLTDMIQTDAAINEGNSGGALVNLQGELIGINSTILRDAEGIGFAISSDLVSRYVNDLLEFGEIQIPWDGIEGRTLTPQLINNLCEWGYKLCDTEESTKGVVVLEIAEEGPAQKAGIIPGDIIVSIQEKAVRTNSEYISWVLNYKPGKVVSLEVLRNDNIMVINMVLGET